MPGGVDDDIVSEAIVAALTDEREARIVSLSLTRKPRREIMMPTRRKAAPAVETVEDDAFEELEDTDLEELEDDDEVEEEAPKTRKRTAKAAKSVKTDTSTDNVYSTNWLAEYVTEVTGENYDARSVRMLLRKMANDGTLARVVGEDRSRYTFPKGENDPIVKAVIKRIKSGELKAVKAEGIERAKKTATKRAKPEPVEDDEDVTPRRTRKAAKAPAPAKAAPTRRKRATADA